MAYVHDRLHAWDRDGFFVVRQLLAAERVAELAEACDHVLAQVRATSTRAGHTSTHITGLFAPEYFAERPDLLARLMAYASSPEVVGLIRDLGLPHDGPLTLRSAHYFHEPSSRDSDGEWHRDGDEVPLPEPELPGARAQRATSFRFRVALAWDDDHLEIVPGLHRRADTPEELGIRRGHVRNAELDGAVRIELQSGDACVFDVWSIHRGRYRQSAPRRTLDLIFGFGTQRRSFDDFLKPWLVAPPGGISRRR